MKPPANYAPPAKCFVGMPSEVKYALDRERRIRFEVKILTFKMIDPWNLEVWYA